MGVLRVWGGLGVLRPGGCRGFWGAGGGGGATGGILGVLGCWEY